MHPVLPDGRSTEAAEEQKEREALAIQNVLEALTDVVFDNDEETDFVFEGKNFEPTIGEVLDANAPSERSVFVEEASLSEPYFRSLVGDNRFVSETADGLVIDLTHLKLGKLTFHRQGEGNNSGYVIMSQAKGYGGNIKIICGIRSDGSLEKVKTLSHNETSGIGSKVADNKSAYNQKYSGKTADNYTDVDTVSGATISSKAYRKAVGLAFDAFQKAKEANP